MHNHAIKITMNEINTPDIHPVTRALMIAVMVIIPLLVVILQRLPALREALKKETRSEHLQRASGGYPADSQQPVRLCPNCHSAVPSEYIFCGYCGKRLKKQISREDIVDPPSHHLP